MMVRVQYDLTIIGGGSAGLTAAHLAQALGSKVLVIDKKRLGGDCLHYGCVPSKSLIHVARMAWARQVDARLGLSSRYEGVDMAGVSAYIQDVIARVAAEEKAYTEGVTVRYGDVSFISPMRLRLNDEEIGSDNVLIATGSHPAIPAIEGLRETGYVTNEDVFDLTALPASLIVAGGGPVGVELAQAFGRLGTNVVIVQGPDRLLPREDPEVSERITGILKSEGIEIVTNTRVVKTYRSASGKKMVVARRGELMLRIEADELLLALGREPNIDGAQSGSDRAGLNLEAAGVRYSKKGIIVNEYLQTSAAHIFALGDVIGGYQFTHVASYQAGVAVRNALVPIFKQKVDYRVVPRCTFSDPEVASVGLTVSEALHQYKHVHVSKLPWAAIDRAQTAGETKGFIKLVLAGKKEEIVGAHMVGSGAGELLGEIALAMQHHLTINDIMNTIHPYPTLGTGLQQVAFEAYLHGPQTVRNRKLINQLARIRLLGNS
ncbi:dihydrolipoyl dehydrogenase family protein [Dictyobacter kobayashii]|uniref:Mercuric reductase n=1 Tax=Dictyobacter kobayashii TaxID=2014872 RepID=A0A402ARH6_9CHLR|nr:NAD(P)/FAD-dependent oxidoreductase [Dictyobacter kobayashii]GCE21689.1 mercuric reductase [Dictyobacter kobayashii]